MDEMRFHPFLHFQWLAATENGDTSMCRESSELIRASLVASDCELDMLVPIEFQVFLNTMMYKDILSAVAIALTFIAFFPYIRSIRLGKTKPHVFSWVIWGSTTFVVFLAQLADRGGAGAWPIGVSGIITLYVAFLAYLKRSDSTVTTTDRVFFILAMSALPLWYVTADPLWAVVILTSVDVMGFAPTFRKAWARPYEEQVTFYAIMAARNLISILALEHYSLTTILFPAVLAAACLVFIFMVVFRRRVLSVMDNI